MSATERLNFKSPAEFAKVGAARVALEPEMSDIVLVNFGIIAKKQGWLKQDYVTVTNRAISIPKGAEKRPQTEEVEVLDYFRTAFEGRFIGFSHPQLRKPSELLSMDAVCLLFEDAVQLPSGEPIPQDDELHVPVLAVKAMARQLKP
ncbi:MAG: hypothetical protein AAB436_03180 [Patescibacteria group bacterium]